MISIAKLFCLFPSAVDVAAVPFVVLCLLWLVLLVVLVFVLSMELVLLVFSLHLLIFV